MIGLIKKSQEKIKDNEDMKKLRHIVQQKWIKGTKWKFKFDWFFFNFWH
jgi:hypothetical protein